MTNLTVLKIYSENEFTPGNEYKIRHGKHSVPMTCIRKSSDAWLFHTDSQFSTIAKYFNDGGVNANITSNNGVIKTGELYAKPLKFIGERPKYEPVTED